MITFIQANDGHQPDRSHKFADVYDAFGCFMEDIDDTRMKPRELELDADQEQELFEYLTGKGLL